MLLDNYSIGLLLFAGSMVATPGPSKYDFIKCGITIWF